MKRLIFASALSAGILLAQAANAFDIGRVRQLPPDDEFTSPLALYDIERCMIEVDAVSVPAVYRQPDRPRFVTLAWFTAIVIDLEQVEQGVLVKTHFESPGGRKARKRLLACAGHQEASAE